MVNYMRELNIERQKSLISASSAMKVYIEDTDGGEMLGEVNCKLLGEISNGETKIFQIDENERRLFVVSDKIFGGEGYLIPAGEESVSLSGKSCFNILKGNPFIFNNGEEQKMPKRYVAILFVIAIILGFSIGFGISSAVISVINGKEKSFDAGDMSITLNSGFDQYSSPNYWAVFVSKDVDVLVDKFTYSEDSIPLNAKEYARAIAIRSEKLDSDAEVHTVDDYAYIIYNDQGADGVNYRYYMYVYKSDGAHWVVHFLVKESKAARYKNSIAKWADSVTFK